MSLKLLQLPFDPDDPLGPFGPVIREYFPEVEDHDEEDDVDGGQHNQEWYGPYYDKAAA